MYTSGIYLCSPPSCPQPQLATWFESVVCQDPGIRVFFPTWCFCALVQAPLRSLAWVVSETHSCVCFHTCPWQQGGSFSKPKQVVALQRLPECLSGPPSSPAFSSVAHPQVHSAAARSCSTALPNCAASGPLLFPQGASCWSFLWLHSRGGSNLTSLERLSVTTSCGALGPLPCLLFFTAPGVS